MFNLFLKKIKNIFLSVVLHLDKYFHFLSDEKYIKIRYLKVFGYKIELNAPKTFNEKIQWLKLYNRNELYTTMVDKYEVKKYVSDIIGEEYIIPTLGIYNSFDEINFEKLPNQFVIKCTHDSGGVVICKNKKTFNIENARLKINSSLAKNYYYYGREWPYKNVKSRIIIESFIETPDNSDIMDYKFFCFNGEPKYILVCSDRNTNLKETFFDCKWDIAPFKRPDHDIQEDIEKPLNLDKMISLARKLSQNIPFLRVDFYETEGKIYFGELTFFPASGFNKFEPNEWDAKLGKMIKLPKKEDKHEK